MSEEMKIDSPLIIVFEDDGAVQTHIHPGKLSYEEYGVLVADLVRHIARAFDVHEDHVWEWVDKERYKPTTPVEELRPN